MYSNFFDSNTSPMYYIFPVLSLLQPPSISIVLCELVANTLGHICFSSPGVEPFCVVPSTQLTSLRKLARVVSAAAIIIEPGYISPPQSWTLHPRSLGRFLSFRLRDVQFLSWPTQLLVQCHIHTSPSFFLLVEAIISRYAPYSRQARCSTSLKVLNTIRKSLKNAAAHSG